MRGSSTGRSLEPLSRCRTGEVAAVESQSWTWCADKGACGGAYLAAWASNVLMQSRFLPSRLLWLCASAQSHTGRPISFYPVVAGGRRARWGARLRPQSGGSSHDQTSSHRRNSGRWQRRCPFAPWRVCCWGSRAHVRDALLEGLPQRWTGKCRQFCFLRRGLSTVPGGRMCQA